MLRVSFDLVIRACHIISTTSHIGKNCLYVYCIISRTPLGTSDLYIKSTDFINKDFKINTKCIIKKTTVSTKQFGEILLSIKDYL